MSLVQSQRALLYKMYTCLCLLFVLTRNAIIQFVVICRDRKRRGIGDEKRKGVGLYITQIFQLFLLVAIHRFPLDLIERAKLVHRRQT